MLVVCHKHFLIYSALNEAIEDAQTGGADKGVCLLKEKELLLIYRQVEHECVVCDPVEGTLTLYSKDFVVWLERVLANDISDEQRMLLEFLVTM